MKTALVTGANRGIGLELCRQLPASGFRVIAVCRRSSTELDALDARVIPEVELTDAASVADLTEELRGVTLDLLVNNAGVMHQETLEVLNFDTLRVQLEVNALAPLRLTAALRGRLAPGAKVAIITSRMGSIADNASGGYYGYRMSKAAVNMAGASLAHDLKGRGVAVFLLHPGLVATGMTGGQGIPPATAASSLLARIAELGLEQSGGFFHANGERLPW
jgi:NAD(P)-dependent dehydrogenase (short-subunit alcohol dehydrogenase family)